MAEFTHFDAEGNAVMVDVGGKDVTERTATAKGSVLMQPETLARIMAGGVEKGDVLSVAQLAGVMGVKRISQPARLILSLRRATDPRPTDCACGCRSH